MVGDLSERVDMYSAAANTQSSRISAFNMKSAVCTCVKLVNGHLASAVMDAEQPPNVQSTAYASARESLNASLRTSANIMAQQVVYNEAAVLQELKEQKQIENDAESQHYLSHIETLAENINEHPNMDLAELKQNTHEMTENYARLQERAECINLPQEQRDV